MVDNEILNIDFVRDLCTMYIRTPDVKGLLLILRGLMSSSKDYNITI